jgi:hypothetical protein
MSIIGMGMRSSCSTATCAQRWLRQSVPLLHLHASGFKLNVIDRVVTAMPLAPMATLYLCLSDITWNGYQALLHPPVHYDARNYKPLANYLKSFEGIEKIAPTGIHPVE